MNHLFAQREMVTSIAIQHNSFICKQSNVSKYHYVILIIQFSDTVKELQVFLFNIYKSIQYYSFFCTQINGSTYCYVSLTFQLNISYLFTQLNGQSSISMNSI